MVQPGQLGFVDPVVTPESMAAGVEGRLVPGVRKGDDGRMYAPFRNLRTGRMELVPAERLAESNVAFPHATRRPDAHLPAIARGRHVHLPSRNLAGA